MLSVNSCLHFYRCSSFKYICGDPLSTANFCHKLQEIQGSHYHACMHPMYTIRKPFLSLLLLLLSHMHTFIHLHIPMQFTQPFTDVLNKDIKVSCRWWSGFDLLRRLLFITVVFFFNYVEPSYTQVCK